VFGGRGVFVAAGDFDNDGVDELVTAAASGTPNVKTWHDTDADLKVFDNSIESFLAFASGFHGGVRVATGNTNNTGGNELITAQGTGGRQVKIWTDSDVDARVSDVVDNPLVEQFGVYNNSFNGGVFVASGIIDGVGNGGDDLVVGPGAGAQKVRIYTDSNASGKVSDNPLFESFFPYGSSWNKGVRVAAGDSDASGTFVEVITAPGAAAGSKPVKMYDDNGDGGVLLTDNPLDDSFGGGAGNAGVFPAFAKVFNGTYSFTGFPIGIFDLSVTQSEITVPASAGKVRDLDVAINLFHSFDGDLDVTLTHVTTGTAVVLFQDVGGSNEGFLIRLNDEAGTDITAGTNAKIDGPISGTFNPGGAALLSVFDEEDASGVWRLSIFDDSGGDSGTLFDWSLFVDF
jgi:subtilisin-like proprotein convertase family protein